MQKGFKKGFLKILKNHKNLQRSVSKTDRDNLKNFKSNSESLKGPSESFEDASEEKIEFKVFSEDFNEDQLKTK